MITEKTIEIAEKAKIDYLKENTAHDASEVKYGYTQRVIELALEEALEAVDKTNLTKKTYTTYDKDMLDFCKSQVKKEIQGLLDEIRIPKL